MAEPESNTITSEELATRVRRVVGRRFRRDTAAVPAPQAPNMTLKSRAWLTHGYDFLVISLALFLAAVFVLNLSIAGSYRERGNQWGDRARWQRELHAWEQQLARQEKQLEVECQRLAATLIARRGPEEQQQALDQISNFRQQLRTASQSLSVTLRQGNSPALREPGEPAADQLSAAALKTKREQLIEMQYAARAQYNSEHPTLQALEHQLEELERQLAAAEQASSPSLNNDPSSRVQVVQNQFLRNASSASPSRPTAASPELLEQVQGLERRFDELRESADLCLRDINQQHQALQQSDEQRAVAWEHVADSLRAMARECAVPVALQQSIAQQDELRREPELTPFSLFLCLLIAIGTSGGIIWHAQIPELKTAPDTPAEPATLSVKTVTKQLGCAPGAILPWDMLAVETPPPVLSEPELPASGKTLQQKLRFASECLLGAAIAVTLIVALTHGQFGDWLAANPFTAWGRLWGS
jgi:hypothetical protein